MANKNPRVDQLAISQWRPGQSGNPLGVKIAVHMHQLIKEKSANGELLMEFAFAVLKGEVTEEVVTSKGVKTSKHPSIADRTRALEILLGYFAGKPRDADALAAAILDASGASKPAITPAAVLEALTDGEIDQLENLLSRGASRAVNASASGEKPPASLAVVDVEPSQSD